MRMKPIISLSLMAAVLMAGCLGGGSKEQRLAQAQKRLFVPEAAPASNTVERPLFGAVKCRPFHALPPANNRSFVIRRAGGEAVADYYNGWLTAPEELFGTQVYRYLEKTGLFAQVFDAASGSVTDLGLDGWITDLYLDYTDPSKPMACVGLRLAILNERSPDFPVVISVERLAKAPVAAEGPTAASQAFSAAFSQTLTELVVALRDAARGL